MSVAGQVANLDTTTSLSGLVHEVYAKRIEPHIAYMDPVAGLFKKGRQGQDFTFSGSKFVFPLDFNWTNDMQGTNGWLPDHSSTDVVRGETTPARLYVRRAFDEFHMERIKGPGAFESLAERIAKSATESWSRGTGIHVHGSTTGTLATIGARTSATTFTVANAYGHVGTNPMMLLKPKMRVALLDSSNGFAVLGASTILSVNTTTKTVTFTTSMEALGGGALGAVGDVLVKIGSTNSSANNFIPERGYAPLGLRDHLDPDAVNTAYLGVSEVTNPEWAPVRKTSVDFTEVEMMAFAAEVAGQGGTAVSERTHTATTHPVVIFELAKTLIGYTQIREKGKTLNGGWETVKIANYDVIESQYHTINELMLHCTEDYRVGVLGGNGGVDGEKARPDGQTLSRIQDFDGAEWYMRAYIQRWLQRRNRSGTLKAIAVSATDADAFSAVPRRNT